MWGCSVLLAWSCHSCMVSLQSPGRLEVSLALGFTSSADPVVHKTSEGCHKCVLFVYVSRAWILIELLQLSQDSAVWFLVQGRPSKHRDIGRRDSVTVEPASESTVTSGDDTTSAPANCKTLSLSQTQVLLAEDIVVTKSVTAQTNFSSLGSGFSRMPGRWHLHSMAMQLIKHKHAMREERRYIFKILQVGGILWFVLLLPRSTSTLCPTLGQRDSHGTVQHPQILLPHRSIKKICWT